jgi:hypothetical protein
MISTLVSTTSNNAVNPIIPGNLQGLAAVRVEYQFDLAAVPLLFTQFSAKRLAEQVDERLARAGLKKNEKSNAALTVAIAVQPSVIMQLGGLSALYAVEVALRELVLLPRTSDEVSNKKIVRPVDSWRHKVTTGILLPSTSYTDSAALLFAAAIQQVEQLLLAWQADQAFVPTRPPGPPREEPSPHVPTPADQRLLRIKEALEKCLSKLAQGNEGSATLEQFEVVDTTLKFRAKVRHRHVIGHFFGEVVAYDVTTRAKGSFGIGANLPLTGKICVEKPAVLGGGEACFDLIDLAPALA